MNTEGFNLATDERHLADVLNEQNAAQIAKREKLTDYLRDLLHEVAPRLVVGAPEPDTLVVQFEGEHFTLTVKS